MVSAPWISFCETQSSVAHRSTVSGLRYASGMVSPTRRSFTIRLGVAMKHREGERRKAANVGDHVGEPGSMGVGPHSPTTSSYRTESGAATQEYCARARQNLEHRKDLDPYNEYSAPRVPARGVGGVLPDGGAHEPVCSDRRSDGNGWRGGIHRAAVGASTSFPRKDRIAGRRSSPCRSASFTADPHRFWWAAIPHCSDHRTEPPMGARLSAERRHPGHGDRGPPADHSEG